MQSKEVKKWQDEEALKRYQMIAPLLDEDLDEAKRRQLREEIAEKYGISKRSLYRYEAKYRENAFTGLRPMNREKRRAQSLPENYDEIVGEAIQLKREVPRRSVRQIIKILETEGYAAPGVIKASTMQRYLYNAGFGVKQMKRYAEKRESSSRRFCRPHRMELLQGDIKYGPDIRLSDGRLIKTYLSSLIDDHSRYIVQSEFYDNQRQEVVEDTFHKAVLKYGKCDACYLDNGTQYTTNQLHRALARLGIRELHAKRGACESKGKIEKFHQKVDQFIAEVRIAKVHSLEELNQKWKYFLEQDYQKEAHEGIKEYYESHGAKVPAEGITPYQEFMRDTRGLIFLDTAVVSEAFLHHETRRLDHAGCFSFEDVKYEASAALANAEVEIAYDPMNTDTVKVLYHDMEPIMAHKVRIDAFCDKVPSVPIGMTDKVPETSRFLDALEKKYKEDHKLMANALSFGEYGKAGGQNV
ncbi:MAG: DDE-type integrase/transposase/recombinase [Lachnospiraceae bacterium]|nr:DDE-type integrase/transposase/recombinase [Lachnospiraceae bacterium]